MGMTTGSFHLLGIYLNQNWIDSEYTFECRVGTKYYEVSHFKE